MLGAACDAATFALSAAGYVSHQWTDEDGGGDEEDNADTDSDPDLHGVVEVQASAEVHGHEKD